MTDDILVDHFNLMFTNFIESIANRDYKALEKTTEKRFLDKINSNKEQLERFELKYDENQVDANESYIIDKLFIKGVVHDREGNDINYDYNYVSHHEHEGIRFYLHKYFVGFNTYYL